MQASGSPFPAERALIATRSLGAGIALSCRRNNSAMQHVCPSHAAPPGPGHETPDRRSGGPAYERTTLALASPGPVRGFTFCGGFERSFAERVAGRSVPPSIPRGFAAEAGSPPSPGQVRSIQGRLPSRHLRAPKHLARAREVSSEGEGVVHWSCQFSRSSPHAHTPRRGLLPYSQQGADWGRAFAVHVRATPAGTAAAAQILRQANADNDTCRNCCARAADVTNNAWRCTAIYSVSAGCWRRRARCPCAPDTEERARTHFAGLNL